MCAHDGMSMPHAPRSTYHVQDQVESVGGPRVCGSRDFLAHAIF